MGTLIAGLIAIALGELVGHHFMDSEGISGIKKCWLPYIEVPGWLVIFFLFFN